jgi:hypothetical protein
MAPKKVGGSSSSSSPSRNLETSPTHSAQMNPNPRKELLDMIDAVLPISNRDRSAINVSLPQRPKVQPLPHTDNELSAPRTAPGAQPDVHMIDSSPSPHTTSPFNSNGKLLPDYKPAKCINEDEADAKSSGTAAFYKTRKFLRKTAAGKVQVPGGATENGASTEKEKPKKLVIIFGKTNVRRAGLNNKCTARLQRSNKRA